MKRYNFIAGSILFHLALVAVFLLLPPPFPSSERTKEGVTFVELKYQPDTVARITKHPIRHTEGGVHLPPPSSVPEEYVNPHGPNKSKKPAMVPVGVPPEAELKKAEAAPKPEPKPVPKPAPSPKPVVAEARPPATPVKPAAAAPQKPAPATPATPSPSVAVSEEAPVVRGVEADKTSINFKYQKGWPVPSMVRVSVGPAGGKGDPGAWSAKPDSDWIIVTPASGSGPDVVNIGVDTSRLSLGYHEGTVNISPARPGLPGTQVSISVMVLPKSQGTPELPHYAWDSYMKGDCKVCHLPKELMPTGDFLEQPEFCGLCHNPSGTAKDKTVAPGGHPVLVEAGSGNTKMPTVGNVKTGEKSDRMAEHLKDGKLIACVTCHNVMQKPGDYGRTWEIASSKDRKRYYLAKGGWENMGYLEPKVYATPGLTKMPQYLSDTKKYEVDNDRYGYDEDEGVIVFDRPRGKDDAVYVTLDNPYLRVTTEGNRLCFDCHFENTHEGLNCLACHVMHGTDNIKCIRKTVRTPVKSARRVVFRAMKGKGSFADGDGSKDGICDACHDAHTRHKDGRDYAGSDCTKCHRHRDGFGM